MNGLPELSNRQKASPVPNDDGGIHGSGSNHGVIGRKVARKDAMFVAHQPAFERKALGVPDQRVVRPAGNTDTLPVGGPGTPVTRFTVGLRVPKRAIHIAIIPKIPQLARAIQA